jgi:hypothetical protein
MKRACSYLIKNNTNRVEHDYPLYVHDHNSPSCKVNFKKVNGRMRGYQWTY